MRVKFLCEIGDL